jgi:hypothetical protein
MEFLIILVAAAVLQFFLPWWVIALVPLVVCLVLSKSGGRAFLRSFAALFVVWLGYAGYLHVQAGGAMSDRVAQIFSLPHGLALAAVAGVVGGLVAGLAGLTGYYLKNLFTPKKELLYR